MRVKPLFGPSIQIDPTFRYYQNRSEASVADEIELAGYRIVRYFVTDESRVNGKLIEAFHQKGIGVWAMSLGNGVYSTAHLPKDWPEWQMTLLKPVQDGFWRFSPFSHKYVKWKKQSLVQLVKRYPFDGLEIAEPYFPEWNGLASGVYGDVGPFARAAFKQAYGSDIPDFKYASSPRYYKKNTGLYRSWMQFRVDAVNRYLDDIVNGPGGVREARPGIRIATWSVAVDAGPDSIERVREYLGVDAPSMIAKVKPDIHFIQTYWPDWMKASLPPQYPKRYERFAEQIRAAHPHIPLGLQADIGSIRQIRRSAAWIREFALTAHSLNYAAWTAYEYHLGKYMYEVKPVPLKAVRLDRHTALLLFNKRIDEAAASEPGRYRVRAQGQNAPCRLRVVRVDGNRVALHSEQFPVESFEIAVSGIKDTPSLWLFDGYPANETPENSFVKVPAYR